MANSAFHPCLLQILADGAEASDLKGEGLKRKAKAKAKGKAKAKTKPANEKGGDGDASAAASRAVFAGRRRPLNTPFVWRFDHIVAAFEEFLV